MTFTLALIIATKYSTTEAFFLTKYFNYFHIIFPWMRVKPIKRCLVPSLIEIEPVALGE